jgi:hypothetical protein
MRVNILLISSILSTVFKNDTGSTRMVVKEIRDIVDLAFDDDPT